ncbi:MAG: hypothetical protein II755_04085 [Prevotella sp.]|nr:hypothetical protein [Prevotella sp.]
MNKIYFRALVLAFALAFASMAMAQRIQTVDTEGNPVGYASVANADNGNVIGATDLKGVLENVGGAKNISISHVAFTPVVVSVASLPPDGTIVLTDAKFELPEVTVKKKEYVYVQTYYRVFLMFDDTLMYYRSGVTDNTYNIRKKTVSSQHEHFSKAKMGLLKFILDGIVGGVIDDYSNLSTNNVCLGNNDGKLTLEKEEANRQRVLFKDTLVGYIVDDHDDHLRRLSIDNETYSRLYHADKDSEKKAKKREKRKEQRKNEVSTRYMVYQIDDDGNCRPEDFVSKQIRTDYDKYSNINKKEEHHTMLVEIFSTDRAYVDKDELKEKKRENKIKMDYNSLMQFEKNHGIPPLPDNALKSLQEIVNK